MSRRFAPAIKKSGAVYIDNSSAFRLDPDVPLVVPEINGADAFENKGIIANPNCCTIIALMAVAGIAKLSPIENMVVCTYQAVSGAGQNGIAELEAQTHAIAAGEQPEVKTFAAQIAMNVIPFIDAPYGNDYTKEEMKMQNEGRRILHSPELKVNCTCVRVPVMRSHSIAVTLRTERKVSVEEAKAAVAAFPGVRLIEDYEGRCYPTPLDTTDQDLVWVGRIREDLTDEKGLTLWCCGDQIRKGAASNAVQILKLLAEKMVNITRGINVPAIFFIFGLPAQESGVDIAAPSASGIVDPDIGLAVGAKSIAARDLQGLSVVALAAADLIVVVVARGRSQREIARLQAADRDPAARCERAARNLLKLLVVQLFNLCHGIFLLMVCRSAAVCVFCLQPYPNTGRGK